MGGILVGESSFVGPLRDRRRFGLGVRPWVEPDGPRGGRWWAPLALLCSPTGPIASAAHSFSALFPGHRLLSHLGRLRSRAVADNNDLRLPPPLIMGVTGISASLPSVILLFFPLGTAVESSRPQDGLPARHRGHPRRARSTRRCGPRRGRQLNCLPPGTSVDRSSARSSARVTRGAAAEQGGG